MQVLTLLTVLLALLVQKYRYIHIYLYVYRYRYRYRYRYIHTYICSCACSCTKTFDFLKKNTQNSLYIHTYICSCACSCTTRDTARRVQVLTLLALLLALLIQKYRYIHIGGHRASRAGAHFTCFPSTKVQILTARLPCSSHTCCGLRKRRRKKRLILVPNLLLLTARLPCSLHMCCGLYAQQAFRVPTPNLVPNVLLQLAHVLRPEKEERKRKTNFSTYFTTAAGTRAAAGAREAFRVPTTNLVPTLLLQLAHVLRPVLVKRFEYLYEALDAGAEAYILVEGEMESWNYRYSVFSLRH